MKRTNTPKQPRAGIIYRGPSMLDGSPIVCIALWSDANAKTGGMLQTYILADNGQSPIEAIRAGNDAAICGDCKHRGDGATYGSRSCYVNVGQGPTVVWKALQRGGYPDAAHGHRSDMRVALGQGRMIRLGTYGDPAAVPLWVWFDLLQAAAGHTGYTHQWRKLDRHSQSNMLSWRGMIMASADTAEEAAAAQAAGWRTFRVRTADEPTLPREFVCPASAEAGAKTDCATCLSCRGNDGRKGNPVIVAHGALARRLNANRTIPLRAS